MPEDKQKREPNIGQFRGSKSPDFRSVYSNNATFQTGPFDFAVTFGEITQVNPAEAWATVEQRVRVTMAPLHAKIFAALFAQQIKSYEQNFGEIKIPPGAVSFKSESASIEGPATAQETTEETK